jgi:hypothetical protein
MAQVSTPGSDITGLNINPTNLDGLNGSENSPYRMGMLAIPIMCTAPEDILNSLPNDTDKGSNSLNASINETSSDLRKQFLDTLFDNQTNSADDASQILKFVTCFPVLNTNSIGSISNNNSSTSLLGMFPQ